MTSSETVNFSALPTPFAKNGARNQIFDDASDEVVNKETGIPEIFAKDILKGGKFIQRRDVNGIAYLLSLFQFYMQVRCVISYEKSVCAQIGGYPKYAVLSYVDDTVSPVEMFFIESTKENNTDVPVPGETIDDGTGTWGNKAWHKLTPSWADVMALNCNLKVVDEQPENPTENTYYFIRGEGVSFS